MTAAGLKTQFLNYSHDPELKMSRQLILRSLSGWCLSAEKYHRSLPGEQEASTGCGEDGLEFTLLPKKVFITTAFRSWIPQLVKKKLYCEMAQISERQSGKQSHACAPDRIMAATDPMNSFFCDHLAWTSAGDHHHQCVDESQPTWRSRQGIGCWEVFCSQASCKFSACRGEPRGPQRMLRCSQLQPPQVTHL